MQYHDFQRLVVRLSVKGRSDNSLLLKVGKNVVTVYARNKVVSGRNVCFFYLTLQQAQMRMGGYFPWKFDVLSAMEEELEE